MTKTSAMHILGVAPGDDERAVKGRFRTLIRKYHPDTSDEQDTGIARELIEAYRILLSNGTERERGAGTFWKAPVNPAAFCERAVLVKYRFFEEDDLPPIEMARGKYLWQPELEEFSLFSKSILLICRELIAEASTRGIQPDIRELFYLLAQEYIEPISCMRILADRTVHTDGRSRYEFPAHVRMSAYGAADAPRMLSVGESMEVIVEDRAAIVRLSDDGSPVGTLSFDEDCMYPVLLPIIAREDAKADVVVREVRAKQRRRCAPLLAVTLSISIGDGISESRQQSHARQIREMIGRRYASDCAGQYR